MSSAVAELESNLQAMLSLKPPGVSGSRITTLTTLCTANVQSESVLVQKLFTHFRRAPGTHKLGVLYVIDSVTRKWLDQAKANGQAVNSSAVDGTYAAGVNKVTELLPTLMNDIITTAPVDQKEKIKKLVEIWKAGQTFPIAMLAKFKAQLTEPQQKSTTPDGTPPRSFEATLATETKTAAPNANTSSILQALANMARQPTTNVPPVPVNPVSLPQLSNSNVQSNSALQTAVSSSYSQPIAQAVNGSTAGSSVSQAQSNGSQHQQSNPPMPQFGAVPPPPSLPGVQNFDPAVQQQLLILGELAKSGVPQEQWPAILAALAATPANAAPPPSIPLASTTHSQTSNVWTGKKQEDSRDRNSYQDSESRFRRRSRSNSPQRTWNSHDSPKTHRDGYDGNRESPRGGHSDRGRGSDYRQRSPPGRRGRSPSPTRYNNHGPPSQKYIDYDSSIPDEHVKVLSRTLFVGGVTTSDQELRRLFVVFGDVQSCIVNRDKRHAFVKMTNRRDAIAAKDGMAHDRSNGGRPYQVRWGVGFGPRDCCDYQAGISIIPISKLTDADRKWMLTAEYGGTGGKPLQSGMVVEEPDIEIGQGVSSKAISRRMQTDRRPGRDETDSPPSRFRQPNRRRDDENWDYNGDSGKPQSRGDSNPMASFPQMPAFPMAFPTLPNGMPMFPPGFVFPGAGAPPQPPPPGRN